MQKLKKILVATDFSLKADNAILRAIDIAKKNAAHITLIHVAKKDQTNQWIKKILPFTKKIMLSPIEYAEQQLKKKIKSFAAHKIKINGVVFIGHPAETIVKYAKKQKIDLLVMGARGEYSIHDWFVGTTTESVAKTTKTPFLVVKNSPKQSYKNILIPVDFSLSSQLAVQFAIEYIQKTKFEVMHVADHEFESFLQDGHMDAEKLISIRKTIIQSLKLKIEHFIHEYKHKKITSKVKFGYPSLEITKEAQRQHNDLIVMGTRGHSKKHYVLLGRVASMVLYEVNIDVLLIPQMK